MAGKIEIKAPLDGVVTIEPEDTASNFTVTIPAVTSTLVNEDSDIEAQVKTATNATGSAPIYACRAWCNFNGTGTVEIRASGNVSSITDTGTGRYTVNFTTAMPDANYAVISLASGDGYVQINPSFYSTTAVGIAPNNMSNAGADRAFVSVAIFR